MTITAGGIYSFMFQIKLESVTLRHWPPAFQQQCGGILQGLIPESYIAQAQARPEFPSAVLQRQACAGFQQIEIQIVRIGKMAPAYQSVEPPARKIILSISREI